MKTMIIGLDGVPWALLRRVFSLGWMPFFKEYCEKNHTGVLRSTLPPVTCPAWPSMLTGQNPAAHGLLNFTMPSFPDYALKPVSAERYLCPTFPQRLSEAGTRSVLINVTGTYPAKPFNGACVTGLLTQDKDRMFFPPSLPWTYDVSDYEIVYMPFAHPEHSPAQHVAGVISVLEKRMRLAKSLFEKETWDHYFIVISETDTLSHVLYNEVFNDQSSIREPLQQFFLNLDESIRWFVEHAPADARIFFVSDHGFQSVHGFFCLNEWLKSKGYLATRMSREVSEEHLATAKGATKATRVGGPLGSVLRTLLAHSFSRKILRRGYPIVRRFLGKEVQLAESSSIDYERTRAFCSDANTYGIYLNDTRFSHGREENRSIASALRDALSMEKPIKKVWLKEELYSGPALSQAPDLLLEFHEGWIPSERLDCPVFDLLNPPGSDHHPEGIVVSNNSELPKHIVDVAPLILGLHGVPFDANENNPDGG